MERGIDTAKQAQDAEIEAELRLQMGILYRLQDNCKQAREHLETSVQLSSTQDRERNRLRAINQMAYLHRFERRFDEGRLCAQEVLNTLDEDDSERAYAFLVLGTIELDERNFTQAIGYFERALHIWERHDNQRMMAWALTNLGLALHTSDNHQQAAEAYSKAVSLFENVNDPINFAGVQMNFGNLLLMGKEPQKALDLYLAASEMFMQANEKLRLIQVNHNIGMAYRRLRQWDEAEMAFESAIEQSQQLKDHQRTLNSLDGLGLTYLDQKQFTKAITTFENALELVDLGDANVNIHRLKKMVQGHLEDAINQQNNTGAP